ncbi:hypothetical protein EVAR_53624_1 [Eumeta japonica]|uniref:Uncharacterized protein n=1 Tax=Eumeta variegata TaxID=151549 RepID=A0A4C1X0E5_EUMVA|nr:hypothetical protein EVAR_53624_1 [Eumeta japonica]
MSGVGDDPTPSGRGGASSSGARGRRRSSRGKAKNSPDRWRCTLRPPEIRPEFALRSIKSLNRWAERAQTPPVGARRPGRAPSRSGRESERDELAGDVSRRLSGFKCAQRGSIQNFSTLNKTKVAPFLSFAPASNGI